MIDKMKLSLFLKDKYLTTIKSTGQQFLNYPQLNIWGFKVSAGSIDYEEIFNTENGEFEVTEESSNHQHPWASLPSSYSGLAIKWWDSNHLTSYPRLEIKGSPAKLMQGHNVFGSSSIKDCAESMINILIKNFPILEDVIDFRLTTLDLMDVTYSANLEPRNHVDFISFLRNISKGQMRKSTSTNIYETTCYLTSPTSKRRVLKAYLKYTEMMKDIAELKKAFEKNPFKKQNRDRLKVMSDPKLIEFAESLVRFEATIKRDWMKYYKYPHSLKAWIRLQEQTEKLGECLIQNIWSITFKPMLDALSGEAINMQNETEIHNKLKICFFRDTKKGRTYAKADRIFSLYMRFLNEGYDKTYRTMDPSTFGRQLKDLCEATGLSEGVLQNLRTDEQSNVVMFCNLINVDFKTQLPDWYQEAKVIGL